MKCLHSVLLHVQICAGNCPQVFCGLSHNLASFQLGGHESLPVGDGVLHRLVHLSIGFLEAFRLEHRVPPKSCVTPGGYYVPFCPPNKDLRLCSWACSSHQTSQILSCNRQSASILQIHVCTPPSLACKAQRHFHTWRSSAGNRERIYHALECQDCKHQLQRGMY